MVKLDMWGGGVRVRGCFGVMQPCVGWAWYVDDPSGQSGGVGAEDNIHWCIRGVQDLFSLEVWVGDGVIRLGVCISWAVLLTEMFDFLSVGG